MNVCEPPAQIAALAGLTAQLGAGFTVNVALHEVVQPFESVTVTEYVPAAFVVRLVPVVPSLHTYV